MVAKAMKEGRGSDGKGKEGVVRGSDGKEKIRFFLLQPQSRLK
jgi:hypothetical protein